MNYYERAQELNEETIANRRYFHTNAEVGLDMPKAKAYVMKKLTEYGLEPKECGYGVTATLQQLRCLKRMSLNWKEQLNLCSSQLRRTSWEARI